MAVDVERRNALQQRIASSAAAALAAGKNVVISAPTGVGKTNIFTNVVARMLADRPELRVIIVQDRIRIGEQNIARARALGLEDVSLSTEGRFDASGQVVFGTTPTLAGNLDRLGHRDVIVIDECHHASEDTESLHSAIIDAVKKINPEAVVLGTSATIERSDKAKLHPTLVEAEKLHITYDEALGVGAIVPPRTLPPDYRLKTGDSILEVVDRHLDPNNPDGVQSGLQKAIRSARPDDFFERSVRYWRERNGGQVVPTFAYAGTIKDAERLRDAFAETGVRAAVVHSKMPKSQIDKAFDDYKAGRIDVLSSVDMLTEGVDETRTQSILCCKETTTRSQWIQINGRAARAHTEAGFDKQQYTVIDMGASAYMHGTMDKFRTIENFALRGPDAEPRYRPWKCVEGSPDDQPIVYALHDGQKTMFAVKAPGQKGYMLLEKAEICVGRAKNATRVVRPASRKPLSAAEIRTLGQDIVRARLDVVTTLESRPANANMRAILAKSYADSRAAVMTYVKAALQPPVRKRDGLSIA